MGMKRIYIKPRCQTQTFVSATILAASDSDAVVVSPTNPGEGGASDAHAKEYAGTGFWGD